MNLMKCKFLPISATFCLHFMISHCACIKYVIYEYIQIYENDYLMMYSVYFFLSFVQYLPVHMYVVQFLMSLL